MKLPSVFANKIDKEIKNNEDYFHAERNTKTKSLKELKSKFDTNGYYNKLNVTIKTKDKTSNEKLILCKDNYFININNQKIYFDDILDYEIKK